LLAAGSVVLFFRKGADHSWGDFALLLVVLIPFLALYLLALGDLDRDGDENEPWRAVLMVTAILLSPIVLAQLLTLFEVNAAQPLLTAGVFFVAALIAGFGAWRARVPYAALLAALAMLVVWLIVWGQILDRPASDTFRLLLIAAGAILLAIAARLAGNSSLGAGELAIAGGVAAVSAGVIGVVVGAIAGVAQPFVAILQPSRGGHNSLATMHMSGLQQFGWDLYLLVVSVGLVWVGSRLRARGLGYVGGFGLLAFLVSVTAQVTRIEAGHAPTSSLVGWPLALLVLGVAALTAPVFARRDS
jgi:hypothetical protein